MMIGRMPALAALGLCILASRQAFGHGCPPPPPPPPSDTTPPPASPPSFGGPSDTAPSKSAAGGPATPSGGVSRPKSVAASAPTSPGPTVARPPTVSPFLRRGPSTKRLLYVQWTYPPLVRPPAVAVGRTTAHVAAGPVPFDDAIRIVAGNDPRPLLVLRECERCNGTETDLFSDRPDNERTFVMSRLFHCVKLPLDVSAPDHPLRGLFAEKHPEHVFVSSRDGSLKFALEADSSRNSLWDSMQRVLTASYDAEQLALDARLGSAFKLLDRLDSLDARIATLEQQVDRQLETLGPKAGKTAKARADLIALKAERSTSLTELDLALRLPLKASGTPPLKVAALPGA